MTAAELAALGYTDLVSVIPPNADPISPNSAIKPSLLGKIPGRLGPYGWAGYPFTRQDVSPEEIDTWGANIGIRGDRFPGVDVDVDDTGLSLAIVRAIRKEWPTAPIRLSTGSRALLMFRTDTPFPRHVLLIDTEDASHRVEVLGEGRQYLIGGLHPSGAQYRWWGANTLPSPEDLPVLNPEDVARLFDIVRHAVSEFAHVKSVEVLGSKETVERPQESLLAPSLGALTELVSKLPNSYPDRESYLRIGYAIKAAGGGRDLFEEWAARWDGGKNDPAVVRRDWDSLSPPYRVGWGYLQSEAERLTDYVSAVDDFKDTVPQAYDPDAFTTPVRATLDADAEPLPFSDEHTARRVADIARNRVLYLPGDKTWYVWADGHWKPDLAADHRLVIREAMTALARQYLDRAESISSDAERKPVRAAAHRLQSATGINHIRSLVSDHVAVPPDWFDKDPWLLNTPGGVYDLRDGSVTPGKPEMLVSRITGVAPAPGPTPLWDRFLNQLTEGDPELKRYLHRVLGYMLTGLATEKILWFVWGSNHDTGKSTFVRIITQIMGTYSGAVAVDSIMKSRGFKGSGSMSDIAKLPGSRVVTATEPASGRTWDDELLKAVSGNDKVSAKFLYGQQFQFMPTFKVLVVGNHQPELKIVDSAMLSRLHIVPMNNQVPKDQIIQDFDKVIVREEGPQILHWMLEGCRLWQEHGVGMPAAVRRTVDEYGEDEDLIREWFEAEVIEEPEAEVSRQELYVEWSAWCRARGESAGGIKTFKRLLDPKLPGTVEETRIGPRRLRGYKGLRLRAIDTFDNGS